MIRRRKGNFKPVLPKAGGSTSKVPQKNNDERGKTTLKEKPAISIQEELQHSKDREERVDLSDQTSYNSEKTKSFEEPIKVDLNKISCKVTNDVVLTKDKTTEKFPVASDQPLDCASNLELFLEKGLPHQQPILDPLRKIVAIPNTTKRKNRLNTEATTGTLTVEHKDLDTFVSSVSVPLANCVSTDALVGIACVNNATNIKEILVSGPLYTKEKLCDNINLNMDTLPNYTSTGTACNSGIKVTEKKILSTVSPPYIPTNKVSVCKSSPTGSLPNQVTHSPVKPSIHSSKSSSASKSAAAKFEPSCKEQQTKDKVNKQRVARNKLKLMELHSVNTTPQPAWEKLDRNLLSMGDLIYINPPQGSGKELGLRNKLRQLQEMASEHSFKSAQHKQMVQTDTLQNLNTPDDDTTKVEERALVPQLRVNEEGSVVLDEESLVVKSTTKSGRAIQDVPALYESGLNHVVNQCSFRRRPVAKPSRWSSKQTAKFFDALRIVGADFGLMSAMFRHRDRDDLRRKYHTECRKNSTKVDEALSQQHLSKWTSDMFKPTSSSDEEIRNNPPAKKRSKVTKRKRQTSSIELLKPSSEVHGGYKQRLHLVNNANDILVPQSDQISGSSLDFASEVIISNENDKSESVLSCVSIPLRNVPSTETNSVDNAAHDMITSIIHQCEVSV